MVVVVVVVVVMMIMLMMIGRGGGEMGELVLRNLMKLFLNMENIAGFCNIAAFKFRAQLPP